MALQAVSQQALTEVELRAALAVAMELPASEASAGTEFSDEVLGLLDSLVRIGLLRCAP